ncbi:peptidase M24, structural domain-containing protein [Phlyctochytrium arcticum]|nr:peptidase M24, structural domain-containing protein [Phlyctochytrium arcticum]
MEIDATRFEKDNDLSNPNVVTKYRTASDIASTVLKHLLQACTPGHKVVDLCRLGDSLIQEATGKIFKKGELERGIAYPTCVSLNGVVRDFSPLSDDETALKAGDLIKINLAVHVDGYISTIAHTTIINANPQQPITGRPADTVCAAYYAAQLILRLLKPGTLSSDIEAAVDKVAETYGCVPVERYATKLKRFVLEGRDIPAVDEDVEELEIFMGDVYSVDVCMASGGDGSAREIDPKAHVLQRDVNRTYNLKLKTSRAAYSEASRKFGVFPFATRELFEADSRHRLGVQECVAHGVFRARTVAAVPGAITARFGFTVLVTPTGPVVINATDIPLPYVHSEFSVDEEGLKQLLESKTRSVKNKALAIEHSGAMDTE